MNQQTSFKVLLLISLTMMAFISSFNLQSYSNRVYHVSATHLRSKISQSREILSQLFLQDERKSDIADNLMTPNEPETYEIKGYLKTDLAEVGDGKQLRVYLYMALALLPCLILIPFFMERDFSPVMDPDAYKF